MVDARDALLNDGTLIEVGCDKVRSGANDLNTALKCLVVGLCTLEGRQEGVVDVDDSATHSGAEHRGQDLHVAGEDDELDAVLLDELEDLRLLLRLGVLGHGQVQEGNIVALCEGCEFRVVGDDEGDLACC